VLRGETASRHDESDISIGKGKRDTRSHGHAMPGADLCCLSRMQVRTGVAGVRILRNLSGADQYLDHFSHVAQG